MHSIKRLFDIPYFQLANYATNEMFVTKTDVHWVGISTENFLK